MGKRSTIRANGVDEDKKPHPNQQRNLKIMKSPKINFLAIFVILVLASFAKSSKLRPGVVNNPPNPSDKDFTSIKNHIYKTMYFRGNAVEYYIGMRYWTIGIVNYVKSTQSGRSFEFIEVNFRILRNHWPDSKKQDLTFTIDPVRHNSHESTLNNP